MREDDDFNWGETSVEDTNTNPFADDDFFSTPDEDSVDVFSDPQGGSENIWSDEPLPNNDDVQGINDQEVFTQPHQKSPLGYKAVAGIIVVFIVVLALFLMFVDRISVTKKPVPQQQTTQMTQQTNNNNADTSKITPDNSQKVDNGTSTGGMQELPSNVTANYTGDLYEATGVIHDKVKYLENSQVVYCLEIKTNIGDKSKIVKYYCGYNTFDSVDTGDTVKVTYQLVSDTCYSVNTISK